MSKVESRSHIAVVPMWAVDDQTQRALNFATTLAPAVIAIHVREREASEQNRIEESWANTKPMLPLVIVDVDDGHDWSIAFAQAIEMLKRTEQVDLITVVVPASASRAQPLPSWTGTLSGQPGIVVTLAPSSLSF